MTRPEAKGFRRLGPFVAMVALASIACQGTSGVPASPSPVSRLATEARPESTSVAIQPDPVASPPISSSGETSFNQRTSFVPLDNPALLTAEEATYLADDDLVLGLEWEGITRAYPIRMVAFHHIVNDTIEGRPFLVTYSIKCSSGVGFDPTMDGQTLTFEVLGLQQGVFTMVDRQTGTVWTHLDGKATQGPLRGARMEVVPMPQMTWRDWRALHPRTMVLSPDTEYSSRYRTPRIGAFDRGEAQFGDDRLAPNSLVVGVEVDGQFKGYDVQDLRKAGAVVNDTLGLEPIVVLYDSATRTGIAYSREVDGQVLEFHSARQDRFDLRDRGTDSFWDSNGRAVDGPLVGAELRFVPSFISEWYGWSGYHPETALHEPEL